MDDAVASAQVDYDMAVHLHGEDSPQAREAEQAIRQLFQGSAATHDSGISAMEHSA